MNMFLPKYDLLKKKINACDNDLRYYNLEITELGLECLKYIDQIGDKYDTLFEELLIKDFLSKEDLNSILY